MCIAVGGSNNASRGRTLAEAWHGKTWSIQPAPRLSSADAYFTGVSCTSATACTAAGDQGSSTLAEAWDGKRWSVQPTPNPAGSTGTFFEDVSCSSAPACTATGYYDGNATVATLAERHAG